ncbi:MAG: xanthine permease [Oscillospiraceae bacterium]|jgi:uracil permease|nr:xanthine permease [Oscillospiraceae bacterium]
MPTDQKQYSFLPDERPPLGKLLIFAVQQILVMFPATVLVAILTGFDIATTIFASGFATICFIFVTGRQIPLFYGSSFSYLAAIGSLMTTRMAEGADKLTAIREAQFGIVLSGLVSIAAGLIIMKFGRKLIDKILPATVTGPVAIIIGLSLAGSALNNSFSNMDLSLTASADAKWSVGVALFTLIATIFFSVYLKGVLSQLPIFFGVITGYAAAAIVTATGAAQLIDFHAITEASVIALPHFSLPKPNAAAVLAIMPIAIATIPESTAHLFQLDIYVNDLAKKRGLEGKYNIADKLGLNLVGDGIGDIIAGFIGGPAGTNYGENLSTMAITHNFSIPVLLVAAGLTMLISFSGTLSAAVNSIPACVIGGMGIYLFGVIAAQGVAIMIEKKTNMFSSKNLAVIAVILILGVGGCIISGGTIPFFGANLPAIATAAVAGIVLNLLLSFGEKNEENAEDSSNAA